MSKTRKELAAQGRLLIGPVVPDWFKKICDGCSVPGWFLKKLLRADDYVASCRIHDWRFYLIAIAYIPGTPLSNRERAAADMELRINIRSTFINPLRAVFAPRVYYRGVRIGGRRSLREDGEIIARCPRTLEDLTHLTAEIERLYPERDVKHCNEILNAYGRKIQRKTRVVARNAEGKR